MKEASFYTHFPDTRVQCHLCPHDCIVKPGKRGSCHVRKNIDGKLIAENYGIVASSHFDPVEKKPLYHFFPGCVIFSIGTIGCNLHCQFCQNAEISQTTMDEWPHLKQVASQDILRMALSAGENIGIAYTYNEPIIWFEFMLEVAEMAKAKNLKNVMVTNGFIHPEPLQALIPWMDAFSVDLKAFTGDFYRNITGASLQPVLEALKIIHTAKRHLEITNLIIPTLNDDRKTFESMCRWIGEELGKETILHLSRYYPTYKMTIERTPLSTLQELHTMARHYLDYVYIGNVTAGKGRDTACNKCGQVVIRRDGYWTSVVGLDAKGRCIHCLNQIAVNT